MIWAWKSTDKVSRDEVDWTRVAEGLGYDGARDESVPGELRRCYEANLVGFLEAVSTFYRDGEEDTGEEADEGSEPAARETRSPYDVTFSPPVRPIGGKRPLDTQQPLSSLAKRRRLGQDVKIPSAPDKIGSAARPRHARQQTHLNHQPHWGRCRARVRRRRPTGRTLKGSTQPRSPCACSGDVSEAKTRRQQRPPIAGAAQAPAASRQRRPIPRPRGGPSREPSAPRRLEALESPRQARSRLVPLRARPARTTCG